MKFKVGDRVAVYATLNGEMVRSKGTVTQIVSIKTDPNYGRIAVKMDKVITLEYIFAHPKQCRKLTKPRSVWVRADQLDQLLNSNSLGAGIPYFMSWKTPKKDWVELREVRKK